MKTIIILLLIIVCISLQELPAQWVLQNSGTTEKLTDVVMLDSTTAIAVGRNRSIFRTTNSGATWFDVAAPLSYTNPWNALSFIDTSNGIVVGDDGVVMTSTNGGKNWMWHQIPEKRKCFSVLHTGKFSYLVGADSGWVYQSNDTGNIWTSEKISTWPILSFFPYRGPVIFGVPLYALTPHSICLRYVIPPPAWSEKYTSLFQGLGSGACDAEFCNGGGNGFIVGVQGDLRAAPTILRKKMSDTAWSNISTGILRDGVLLGVSAPSANVIYVCGSGGMIFKSTNGGDTWKDISAPTTQSLNAIYFYDEKRGFAVGDSGKIFFTSNGGGLLTNNPPLTFELKFPVNEDTMFVMRSISFGWQRAIDPDNDTVRYTVLIKRDTSATWVEHGPTVDTSLQVHSPAQIPGKYLWTVLAKDSLYATPSLDIFEFTVKSVVDVEKIEGTVPHEFSLFQNYPNPFNPTTVINYQLPVNNHVTLKVYDMLGREAATLVNEMKDAGSYSIAFNASKFSSGVYFARLQSGNKTQLKKMSLIK
ncbi:MAG: YCF48-related protein [Bacteroidota bacterium]|nr:YCF48-related protein [Bacteroidota bacterium]